jgi:hypothetical protein
VIDRQGEKSHGASYRIDVGGSVLHACCIWKDRMCERSRFRKGSIECRKKKAPPSKGRSAWRVEEELLSAVDRVTMEWKFYISYDSFAMM